MGALGGSWYLNKGGAGGYYDSRPCRDITADDLLKDAKELDKLVKELNIRHPEWANRPDAVIDVYHHYDDDDYDDSYNSDDDTIILKRNTNTVSNMVQTLVLKHEDNAVNRIKGLTSITKRDKTIGITFTDYFLMVIAVGDYVGGDIPIILYARDAEESSLYNRYINKVGKLTLKDYGSTYFGRREKCLHLKYGNLNSDFLFDAIQLARQIDKIIKKDIMCQSRAAVL